MSNFTDEKWREIIESCTVKPDGHVQKDGDSSRLYTVTTIAQSARYGGQRTPVICSSFDNAKEIVEINACDIYETTYKLSVIEAVLPDALYGGDLLEQYWYLWIGDYETGKYMPIETPTHYENVFGFGIG